jgi:aminoglycoside phosphotransferase (APT) family kinase protein
MSDEAVADYEAANPSFRKTDVAGIMARDLDTVAAQLREIVGARVAGGRSVEILNLKLPVGAGSSNETILFDAVWQKDGQRVEKGMVLRIAPSQFQLFMDPRMGDQFALLGALYKAGRIRVAEPILFDDSKQPFGQTYMIMGKLHGRVPVSFPPYNAAGFLFDASVEQRRTAWESSVDQLAAVVSTPIEEVAFLGQNDDDGSFAANLAWWYRLADWAKISHLPAIAALKGWLEANRPADPPPGLSWGDARMGNMMFGEDFTITGVMDWEQMSLGGALLDLGWWLYFDRFHAESLGLTRLEGLGTRAETLERWQQATGIEPREIEWYEMLAGYKLALITARKSALEGLCEPRNNGNNNIITQQNARMLGTAQPEDVLVPLEV